MEIELALRVLAPVGLTFTVPLPCGAIVMGPFAPADITIEPEFVPLSVSSFKFVLPSLVIVGTEPPTLILPFPFGATVICPSTLFVIIIEPEFTPPLVSSFKSVPAFVVIVGLVPPITTLPVPSGATVIFWLAPSVIVIEPVVEFPVFNVTSVSPLDLKTPSLPAVPGPVAKAASYVLHSPTSPLFPCHKNLCSVTVPVFSFNTKPPLSPMPLKLVAVPLPSTFNSSVGS